MDRETIGFGRCGRSGCTRRHDAFARACRQHRAAWSVQQYVREKQDAPLELRIYSGANGRFTLYDDDGSTYRYEQGQRSMISMTWNDKAGTLLLGARQGEYEGMPSHVQLHVRLLRRQQWLEKDVTYSGQTLSIHF